MQHQMGLYAAPYASIQSGRKRFEIRLHDEKRRRITVGDTIAFTLNLTERFLSWPRLNWLGSRIIPKGSLAESMSIGLH